MPLDPFAFDVYVADYVATVDDVNFVETEYGNVQAVIRNKYDEPIQRDDGELSTSRTEFVSVGSTKEWEVVDGGRAFTHRVKGDDARLKPQSSYAQLLQRAVSLVGRDGLLDDSDATRNSGLHSDRAWLGKRFHWVTEGAGETKTFNDRQTGEKKTVISKGHQLPVEYLPGQGTLPLGDDGVVESYDVDGLGLDDAMLIDLVTLAQGLSYGEFQAKAVSFLGDLQDDPRRASLGVALNEQSFYQTLRG
jgi:hypothetical protein